MKVLVVSDLHVGSQYAACPKGFMVTDEDAPRRVALHDWQTYLNKCWKHTERFIRTLGKIDYVIINGDALEGEAYKSMGHGLTLHKFPDQIEAAVMHCQWLRDVSKRLYVVKGTPYHEGHPVAQAVEGFARALGADKWRTGLRTGTRLWRDVGGLTLNASHHMTRGFIYLAAGAERTALFNVGAASLDKLPKADIIIRSHNHVRRILLGIYDRDVVFTPAWQLVTPYAVKHMEENRAENYSDLGSVLIEITPNRSTHYEWRALRYANCKPEVDRG